MKVIDIALKDLTRSLRTAVALVFMFGLPLLVTALFYFMFGNIAAGSEFDLPATKVIVANSDVGSPLFQASAANLPAGIAADTLGGMVIEVLQNEGLAELLEVSLAKDAEAARAAVDNQDAQVAVLIPIDFSEQFVAPGGQAAVELYQDPTLTIGPAIVKSILGQFMDAMSGAKIAVGVAFEESGKPDPVLAGEVVQLYLASLEEQNRDPQGALLELRSQTASQTNGSPVAAILGPIMAGMMIFFAFYTGTATAESILKEEEDRTLPRLFTTPTSQSVILTGKFVAVFLTVMVQIIVLLLAGRLIFGIHWGDFPPVALTAVGIVVSSASLGILINSMLKNTKQGGVIFGGVLTLTGITGMISVFAQGSSASETMGKTVSLLVPQGWALRGLTQSMNGLTATEVIPTLLGMLAWSVAFFAIGAWRFNRRYA